MSITLPTIQNWSCHSCGDCCRQKILLTDADRRRILEQKWTVADGVPEGEAAFVKMGGQYLMAHQPDGACVFLDANNRCRIHAKFGEAAKPLGCRVFPFAFYPTGERSVGLGLRFDCPSVAANRGAAISEQGRMLRKLQDLAVPDAAGFKPPTIAGTQRLDWGDTMRIVSGLRRIVCENEADTPLPLRLVHALFVAGMLGKATFDKVRGERIDDLVETLATAAPLETAQSLDDGAEPSGLAKTQFRLIVAQYGVRDVQENRGIGYRLGKALAGFRLARGKGRTPAMQRDLPRVGFADLEETFAGADEEIDGLWERYFDVRLSGMGFCGLGCYRWDVVEGFVSLVLLYPVTMYLARWVALGRGSDSVSVEDVRRAMGIVDPHHGRSPAMAMGNFRRRVRWLVEKEELGKLVAWYGK
jgi:lysine-N-methylase